MTSLTCLPLTPLWSHWSSGYSSSILSQGILSHCSPRQSTPPTGILLADFFSPFKSPLKSHPFNEDHPQPAPSPPLPCSALSYLLIDIFLNLFIFIFGCVGVFVAARGLSLVAASGGYSLLRSVGSRAQAQ